MTFSIPNTMKLPNPPDRPLRFWEEPPRSKWDKFWHGNSIKVKTERKYKISALPILVGLIFGLFWWFIADFMWGIIMFIIGVVVTEALGRNHEL